jgi:hypothetical protein
VPAERGLLRVLAAVIITVEYNKPTQKVIFVSCSDSALYVLTSLAEAFLPRLQREAGPATRV